MNNKNFKDILDSAANDSLSRNSDLWPKLSVQIERNSPMITSRTRPMMAILLTLLTLLVLSGAAYAFGRTLGYIPGYGLVDNSTGLRILAEPAIVTRDGMTVVISSVFVYPDRVELVYDVNGLAPEYDSTKAADAADNPAAFCGGENIGSSPKTEGDARLELPDGRVLERDFSGKYPQNAFAMKPVYEAVIPHDVMKMIFVLDCIPFARRGAVPEHWRVPFELKSVPAGTVIGAPVIKVNTISKTETAATLPTETAVNSPAATSIAPAEPLPVHSRVTFSLVQSAQTANGPVFYFQLHVENPALEMLAAIPRDVYVIDSQGQKIQYMNNSPYSEDPATIWEYVPTAKPAAGPLRLVMNDAVLKFAPPNPITYSFDAGQNPQYNQTWALNKEFSIAGYKVTIESARAITFDDIKENPDVWDPNGGPDIPEGSQGYDKGYQFTIKLGDSVSNLQLDPAADSCRLSDLRNGIADRTLLFTHLCLDGYPKGQVNVILRVLSVVVSNVGQINWSPDGTVSPTLPQPYVTLKLEKSVSLDSSTVLFFRLNTDSKDPALISIMPLAVTLVDSLGQKFPLVGNFTWQPFEHRVGSIFEFMTQEKPASGPLALIVENAVAIYAPLYTVPPAATPDEMSFTFNAGENPQLGQTWNLNKTFQIAGYPFKITSVRATTYAEVKSKNPDFSASQGYEYGYDFTVETDPSVKMLMTMDILSETPACWLDNSTSIEPKSSTIHFIQLCRAGYPSGDVRVNIHELSVLVQNTWQAAWKP